MTYDGSTPTSEQVQEGVDAYKREVAEMDLSPGEKAERFRDDMPASDAAVAALAEEVEQVHIDGE